MLVDGERINSCLALAVQYQGRGITTVEGLGAPGSLHPLQEAFIDHDGFQCGYCTPGQLCSAVGMTAELRRGVPSFVSADVAAVGFKLTPEELRERMSGNLCRCGAYNGIADAILQNLRRCRPWNPDDARDPPMTPFAYERAPDLQAALALGGREGAKYLGGGTNLVDLMRETIEHPQRWST